VEPRWVDRLVVDAIHLDQLREHGGLAGVRDENALEAALARPRQRWHYEPDVSIPALAAAYGFGISRGHPYRDGNKRVSFVVLVVFLELNGWRFSATETEVVEEMVALAAGRITEAELAQWVAGHCQKQKRRGPRSSSGEV
jgi:death-on-curing protein